MDKIKENVRRFNLNVELVLDLKDFSKVSDKLIKEEIKAEFLKSLKKMEEADLTRDLDVTISELPLNV